MGTPGRCPHDTAPNANATLNAKNVLNYLSDNSLCSNLDLFLFPIILFLRHVIFSVVGSCIKYTIYKNSDTP